MPITVPSSSLSPAPPMIDGDHIPNNEREAVRHLFGLLFLLGWYEQQFRHALALFDACEKGPGSVPKDIKDPPKFDPPKYPIIEAQWHTLHGWKAMAARDGALAIYHFGQALAAISPRLHDCPTISARVDHPAVRLARKAFRAALPSYDARRLRRPVPPRSIARKSVALAPIGHSLPDS